MKKIITLIMMLFALSFTANAQQQQSDTITYWMEYNFDNLDANDYDSIWNVRCFIEVPMGVTMKKFHLKMDDLLHNINNVCNVNSPAIDTITAGFIPLGVYTVPQPKRAETNYQPSYIKSNYIVVADLGYHRNHYYEVEIKPKDYNDNEITKVKKLKEVKY